MVGLLSKPQISNFRSSDKKLKFEIQAVDKTILQIF